MTRGDSRFWLLLGAALVLVIVLAGGAGGDGPALDPRSVNPDGARGVVETMERAGARVDLDSALPDASATSALLLQDRLSDDDQAAIRRWVSAGGVLVVADVRSELAARDLGRTHPFGTEAPSLDQDVCTIDVLAEAGRLDVAGALLQVSGNSCFGDGDRAFIVERSLGSGTIVTVGSPDLFTNAVLDEQDAAVVALNLLTPSPDNARVAFLGPSIVDFGDDSLADLVAPRVRNAIMQMLAAFLLYALYRSRRLGKVVSEPMPVRIEGSEVVLKAGLLSQRAKDPVSAARLVRQDFIDRARHALSIPTADNELLVERLADRTNTTVEDVRATLFNPVVDDTGLVWALHNVTELDTRLFGDNDTKTSLQPTSKESH